MGVQIRRRGEGLLADGALEDLVEEVHGRVGVGDQSGGAVEDASTAVAAVHLGNIALRGEERRPGHRLLFGDGDLSRRHLAALVVSAGVRNVDGRHGAAVAGG